MHRHMKTERLSLSVLFIFLLISTVSLTSCGGGGGGGGKDSSNPSITQMSQVIDAGVDHYNDLLSKGSSIENALTDTINWYKAKNGVLDAYPSVDGVNIFIKDVNGITSVVALYSIKKTLSASQYLSKSNLAKSVQLFSNVATIGKLKAAILDPLSTGYASSVLDFLTGKGVDVHIFRGEQFTPLTFLQLQDYDIIYYVGHVGVSDERIKLQTGVPYSEAKIKDYEEDITSKGYEPVTEGDHKYLGLFGTILDGDFIGVSNYFIEGVTKELKATVVYIDGCNSLHDERMANAFLKSGAKSYFGWSWYVVAWGLNEETWLERYLLGITDLTTDVFDNLLNCKSVQTSYFDALLTNPTFEIATLLYKGDGNAKLLSCESPIIDTTPPTVPTGLTAIAVSSSQINLSWNASTDNVGVAGYKIYRGGNLVRSVTGLSTSDTGLSPNTQYCYKVSSYDAANNESLQSIQACATTLPSGYASPIYVSSGQGTGSGPSYLFSIVPTANGSDTSIGLISTSNGFQPVITDLALPPSGTLYGVSFDALYVIDKATAWATKVGNLGFSNVNALASDSQGNLYGATLSGYLLRINTSNGAATPVGQFGSGFTSSGDLAFSPGGILYAAVYAPNIQNNLIVTVAPNSGTATRINNSIDTGLTHLYGLSFVNGQLYGVTADSPNGALWLIDVNSGQASFVRNLSFSAFGAASFKNRR